MKSDREFLEGIYKKAETLSSNSKLDYDFEIKENYNKSTQKQHASPTKYVKYAGIAAGFLLLISSSLYLNKFMDKNNQIDTRPNPHNMRIINYRDQLMEQATDIVHIQVNYEDNKGVLSVIKIYKDSGNELMISNYLNNDVIGLTAGQSAIVFIDWNSENTPIMDVFIREADSNSFINPYGEIITEEILEKSN